MKNQLKHVSYINLNEVFHKINNSHIILALIVEAFVSFHLNLKFLGKLEVFCKNGVLKISQNSQENACI